MPNIINGGGGYVGDDAGLIDDKDFVPMPLERQNVVLPEEVIEQDNPPRPARRAFFRQHGVDEGNPVVVDEETPEVINEDNPERVERHHNQPR